MILCGSCQRRIYVPLIRSFSLTPSKGNSSNDRRPTGLQATDTLKSGNLVAFRAQESFSKYIQKDLKYSHAALLPHLALNLSGLGYPYLNYYYHPGIFIGMAIGTILYPALFVISPRITYLAFNESNSMVHVHTSFCQRKLALPINVCKFEADKRLLKVCDQTFKFSPSGKFNTKNLTILKRLLRASDHNNSGQYSHSRQKLIWNELTSLSYIIIFTVSVATLFLHCFIFGYTDLMYSIVNLLAFFDRDKVMEKWKPLIK